MKWPISPVNAIRLSRRKRKKRLVDLNDVLAPESIFFSAVTKAISVCNKAIEIIKLQINLKKRESDEKAPNSHQVER
jgi:hypothetical protein